MGCRFYEVCDLRIHGNGYGMLKKYIDYHCEGGDDAVAECNHRYALIQIENLEKELTELKEKTDKPLSPQVVLELSRIAKNAER